MSAATNALTTSKPMTTSAVVATMSPLTPMGAGLIRHPPLGSLDSAARRHQAHRQERRQAKTESSCVRRWRPYDENSPSSRASRGAWGRIAFERALVKARSLYRACGFDRAGAAIRQLPTANVLHRPRGVDADGARIVDRPTTAIELPITLRLLALLRPATYFFANGVHRFPRGNRCGLSLSRGLRLRVVDPNGGQ
jgi:hypothetical protein